MSKLVIWKTASIVQETIDTVTIYFDTASRDFVYRAGQFINLTVLIDGNPVTRSYSLSSVPEIDPAPAITVKKIAGGLMSSYIVDHASEIRHWQVEGPYGSFTAPAPCKHVVLLAAGSGITPVYPIAISVLRSQLAATVTIILSNRNTSSIIFSKRLEKMKQRFGERVDIIHSLSQHRDTPPEFADELIQERLNKSIIKKLIKKYIPEISAAHYFICGPSSLIRLYEEAFTSFAIPEENILAERFNPEEPATPVELPTQMYEVMLHFHEQSNLLEVHPGYDILSTALQDRIALPNSCKNGTCGKCTARVTSGQIVMKQNHVLRKEELEAGLVLLCQSYPLNDEVTVEIG